MPLFWFIAGVLTTLAVLVVLSPWLRTLPAFASLPAAPWQGSVVAIVIVAALFASYGWLVRPDVADRPSPPPVTAAGAPSGNAGAFGTAAKVFGDSTGPATSPGGAAGPASKPGAGSMDSAIAALEARLAKGGGTPDDWELLAKSFEFLGRPADAAKARAKQLPSLAGDSKSSASAPAAGSPAAASRAIGSAATASPSAAGSGVAVTGEVTLAAGLASKTTAGETLFIVAKSVDAPGIPVAVFRGSVGNWPLKFTLDDSQAMMPGRNLSSAGRVTIEARISQKGQPLPAAGDLQGSSGVINPADQKPLKITIDRVIS
jgi:cytochrome c-type biogenesis protein CcmH